MNADLLSRLESFNFVSKIPCIIFDRNKNTVAFFHSGLNDSLQDMLSYSSFHYFRKKLSRNDPHLYVIGRRGDYRFIVMAIIEEEFCGTVVAGPFPLNSTSISASMQILPDGRDLAMMMHFGKLLSGLVNRVEDYENVKVIVTEDDFNPFPLEQYFIDNQQYMLSGVGAIDYVAVYTELNEAVLQRDATYIKLFLQRLFSINFHEPACNANRPDWNTLRLKKNMMLSFFSVFNYIVVQQRWSSSFYIYFCSLYTTIFETCCDENDLLGRAYELIDNMFNETISDCRCTNTQIRDACFYICNNLSHRLDLKEVSSYIGLSEKYFSKLFKQEMGISFKQYVDRAKVSYTKNLLRFTKKNITEISIAIAVEPASNFALYFKKHTGMTPMEYRNADYG